MSRFNNIYNFIRNSRFVRGTFLLEFSSVFTTGLTFLTSIIYARFLGADLYGQYSLLFAVLGFSFIFLDLGTDQAAVTFLSAAYYKRDKKEILDIITFLLEGFLLIYIIIGGMELWLVPKITMVLYHYPDFSFLIRILLLHLLLRIFFLFLSAILQALRQIKRLVIFEMSSKFLYCLLTIIFILMGLGLRGIALGYLLVTSLFVAISLAFYYRVSKEDKLLPKYKEIFKNFGKVAVRRYISFALFIALNKGLVVYMQTIPIIFLGMFVPSREVGFLKIAFSYVMLPLFFEGPIATMLNIQFPRSRTRGDDKLKKEFFKVSMISGLVTIIVTILFLVLAPYLVVLFYSKEFLPAVKLIYIFGLYAALSGFFVGSGAVARALEKLKIIFVSNFCMIVISSVFIYLAVKKYQAVGAVWALTLSLLAANIVGLAVVIRYFCRDKESPRQ